jgi:hypothetical protein
MWKQASEQPVPQAKEAPRDPQTEAYNAAPLLPNDDTDRCIPRNPTNQVIDAAAVAGGDDASLSAPNLSLLMRLRYAAPSLSTTSLTLLISL